MNSPDDSPHQRPLASRASVALLFVAIPLLLQTGCAEYCAGFQSPSVFSTILQRGCAKLVEQPKPIPPSDVVAPHVHETLKGKTAAFRVPSDMRTLAVDYLRAAGATVVEGGLSEFVLEAETRTESARLPSGRYAEQLIVDVYILRMRPDNSRQILFRGTGQAAHYTGQHERLRSVAAARALVDLH